MTAVQSMSSTTNKVLGGMVNAWYVPSCPRVRDNSQKEVGLLAETSHNSSHTRAPSTTATKPSCPQRTFFFSFIQSTAVLL